MSADRLKTNRVLLICIATAVCSGERAMAQCAGRNHRVVSHTFNLYPNGDVIPQVTWSHREATFAQQSTPVVTDPRGNHINRAALGPGADLDIAIESHVGSTCGAAHSKVQIVRVQPSVVGTITCTADAYAHVDPPWRFAKSSGAATAVVECKGGTRMRDGLIKWYPNWKASDQIVASAQDGVNDPITAIRTDLNTGITQVQTLLTITARSGAVGDMGWQNDHLTNSKPTASFHVNIASPWTLEQGSITLEVQNGLVTQSSATGMFAGAALPPVGAGGNFDIALPSEIDLHYDMGGSDADNLDCELDFSGGGEAEDAAAEESLISVTGDSLFPAYVTDYGTATNMDDVSTVQAPSVLTGSNIAVNAGHIADDFTVPPNRTYHLAAMTLPVFQQGSAPTDRVLQVFVRLWIGPPGAGGVVFAGNMTTNRLLSTDFAHAYRVLSDPSDASRAIKEVLVDMTWAPLLSPGTYWIEIAAVGMTPYSGPFAVPQTPRRSTDNGRQFNVTMNMWSPIVDAGMGVDFPFRLYRVPPGDMNGDAFFNGLDVQRFMNCFLSGGALGTCTDADFNADGLVNMTDVNQFVSFLLGQ